MGLSAWEQQALDSIKSGISGSDPELASLLSAFTQLAAGEEMPDRERVAAGPRRALRRLRRNRQHFSLSGACRSLSFQRSAVLLLWLLTTAALIAVTLVLNTGGGNGSTCTETMTTACAGPAPGHGPGSPSNGVTDVQVPLQPAGGIQQAGP